jgi:hypothetical protein
MIAALSLCINLDILKAQEDLERQTRVSIVGEEFHINGSPTYSGQVWQTLYGGEIYMWRAC